MSTTAKVITGALVGAILGTITGILIAPASGRRTRKKIGKRSKKLARQVAGYVGMEKIPSHTKNGKASVEA